MRRRALAHDIELDDHIDLTPMLDCVFVLLLFLIIATTFDDSGLFKVTLPTADQPAVHAAGTATTLLIDADGRYAIGQELVPATELADALRALKDGGRAQALLIKGDQDCPYREVVRAFDAAQAIGIAEVGFVVDRARPR
ncbi:MAG TPA: biopolymer transporter ExbD [Planctomycetota bacterium]|nr:biopolymer transporter ExbD [Planctomycetota bacterium]